MTKHFSETERELLYKRIVDTGRELFAQFGLKKTNVEDITSKVGIAKGSFYAFFDSKEELFFEIMETIEDDTQSRLAKMLSNPDEPPEKLFRSILKTGMEIAGNDPFLRLMSDPQTFEYLMRKLPPERIVNHIQGDKLFAEEIVRIMESRGIRFRYEPSVISGMFRAWVLLMQHKSEIGENEFDTVMDAIYEAICDKIILD